MSDEPRDEVDPEETPPDLPEDDKGLGLTEEFRRIEAEIDAELGGSADLDAPDDLPEGDGGDLGSNEPTVVRWDDDDSSEWPVAPVDPLAQRSAEERAEAEGDDELEAEETASEAAAEEEPATQVEGAVPAAEEPASPDADAEPEPVVAAQEQPESQGPPQLKADEPAIEHTSVRRRPPSQVAIPAGGYGRGGGGGSPIADEDLDDRQPRLWWRFLAASVLIVAATATAVSLSSLLFLTDVAARLQPIPNIQDKLTELDPGDPQTILIIGSDKRANTPGDPGRSDTTMLLRVDAEKKVLSLFSLPRDLRVDIAGKNYGEGRLNEAFTAGGVQKTLATVQDLTGLEINHVVNVDFQGFADAVDAIGCVYVDIDRDYFNDNSGYGEDYATIDVNAGYQRLCGLNALDYVRYRHTDTTFVRDARQQDFLRNARAQVPVSQLAPAVFGGEGGSSELIDVFTEYTSSDIHTSAQVIGLLKAFLIVKDVPINEVHFKGSDEIIDGAAYVTATQEDIEKAVDEFLGDKDSKGPRGGPGANAANEPVEEKSDEQKAKEAEQAGKQAEDPAAGANVISTGDSAAATAGGIDKYEAFGRTSARRLKFPIYVPGLVVPGSAYDPGSRQYDILDLEDDKQSAYKMVISLENPAVNFEYYGIQGTTWNDPPILEDPSETRTYDGREYDLYYDGDRLRMVAFHDGSNAYWVSNTLLQTLDESQMLAIATSMTEVKEPDEKK